MAQGAAQGWDSLLSGAVSSQPLRARPSSFPFKVMLERKSIFLLPSVLLASRAVARAVVLLLAGHVAEPGALEPLLGCGSWHHSLASTSGLGASSSFFLPPPSRAVGSAASPSGFGSLPLLGLAQHWQSTRGGGALCGLGDRKETSCSTGGGLSPSLPPTDCWLSPQVGQVFLYFQW